MTLISFFDEDPLDNVGDILYFQPKTCIFIGESPFLNKEKKQILSRFLKERGLDVALEYHSIPRGDLAEGRDRLARLAGKYGDCIFDLSGGTKMLITLAGYVAGQCHIPMYQRKPRSNRLLWQLDCDLLPRAAFLKVREVVSLHSGKVLHASCPPGPGDPLFRKIPLLWDLARRAPSKYNGLCNSLSYLMGKNESSAPLELRSRFPSAEAGKRDLSLLSEIERTGLITDLEAREQSLRLKFSCRGAKELLTKAGNLLETVVCLAGSFADDAAMGVSMDWDGIENREVPAQTRNELDVMLTIGLLPVCISCKNGAFDKNALYELDTVSRHFAGRFAKRILVGSCENQASQTVEHLRQRALDMNIVPLFDAQNYSFEELSKLLRKHCLP